MAVRFTIRAPVTHPAGHVSPAEPLVTHPAGGNALYALKALQ